jgi:hypothetical protein
VFLRCHGKEVSQVLYLGKSRHLEVPEEKLWGAEWVAVLATIPFDLITISLNLATISLAITTFSLT